MIDIISCFYKKILSITVQRGFPRYPVRGSLFYTQTLDELLKQPSMKKGVVQSLNHQTDLSPSNTLNVVISHSLPFQSLSTLSINQFTSFSRTEPYKQTK